jgi:hypothetical protein
MKLQAGAKKQTKLSLMDIIKKSRARAGLSLSIESSGTRMQQQQLLD